MFSPYVKYVDPAVRMPRGVKVAAVVSMWTSIGLSTAALRLGGASVLLTSVILAAGVAGTWMIVAFRSGLPK
jgi:uncharacterized membrane protein YbaN (DUF454 family)